MVAALSGNVKSGLRAGLWYYNYAARCVMVGN